MDRRRFLATAGSAGLVGTAGCLGIVGLDSHEASPAGVTSTARSQTGYEQIDQRPLEITETVNVLFYSEDVTITNYLTEHEKQLEVEPLPDTRAAVFLVLTTPQVSVLGQQLNPIGEMDARELAELIVNNYGQISNVRNETTGTVTILEQETGRSRFRANAQFNGQDVPIDLHVSESVETDADLLVTLGVYPYLLRDQEEDNILELMRNVTTETQSS